MKLSKKSKYGEYNLITTVSGDLFITLHEGTENELQCFGYQTDYLKAFLYYLFCLLTLSILWLVGYWRPDWKHKLTHKACPLAKADSVLIRDPNNQHHPVKIEIFKDHPRRTADVEEESSQGSAYDFITDSSLPTESKFFEFRFVRYFWDESKNTFVPLRGLDQNLTFQEIRSQLSHGLYEGQAKRRMLIFKKNLIDIKVKSMFLILAEEASHPFYIFQLFSIAFWIVDKYYYFAGAVFIVSIFSITVSAILTRQNCVRLRKLATSSSLITVLRLDSDDPQEISSTNLVPGDLIVIPPEGMTMECDAILITGNCVVKEGFLTGESVSTVKTHIDDSKARSTYNPIIHTEYTLLAGTQVIQARSTDSTQVLAVVMRTGFYTVKGGLVRDILYPKSMDTELYRDACRFLGLTVVIALLGIIYSAAVLCANRATTKNIVLRTIDIITIAIPPQLPIALSIGVSFALNRLRKAGIFCINPSRINISGKINRICFDKTGTLTENDMEFSGIISVINRRFIEFNPEMHFNPWNPVGIVMATCHSIVLMKDGELCGAPMEIGMYRNTEWTLHEIESGNKKYNVPIESVLRLSTYTKAQCGPTEIGILKRFHFSPELRRMSVVIMTPEERKLYLTMKGAPETVIRFCNEETVPYDFTRILREYTTHGYRVIALAHKQLESEILPENISQLSNHDLEKNMTFVGLLLFQNKLKAESSEVIEQLIHANIPVNMITGDHLETAIDTARKCNIIQQGSSITCIDIDEDDNDYEKELEKLLQQLKLLEDDRDAKQDLNFRTNNIACTGRTLNVLLQYRPDLFFKFISQGVVFARMSPVDKAQLVEGLVELGNYVAMCGDGANDCGALSAAHIGISLSDTEASAVSQFTSKISNISCVLDVIREGRAALATSVCILMYVLITAIAELMAVLLLYWTSSNFSDLQFLYLDLFLSFMLIITMSRATPHRKLSVQRPSITLFNFNIILTLAVLSVITIVGQAIAYIFLKSVPWYKYSVPLSNGSIREFTLEGTTLFYYVSYQFIWIAVILTPGPPFQNKMYKNWSFILALIITLAVSTVLLFHPGIAASSLKLKAIPDVIYKILILIMGFVYFTLSYAFKEFVNTVVKTMFKLDPSS
ncbi:putative cation-transporting ATPase 13A3 [Trichoplax sp. H2]|nr:putative cation-transporting ATPase 13A3 [Trichoplax sp. H2]|eukprot:RDD38190.1 putative cation-transporting ATPase 13A3 [Trichoplax sp. H2]